MLQPGNHQSRHFWTVGYNDELAAQRAHLLTGRRTTDLIDRDRRERQSSGDNARGELRESRAEPELDDAPRSNSESQASVTSYDALLLERDGPLLGHRPTGDLDGEEASSRRSLRDVSRGYVGRPQTDLEHDGVPRRVDSAPGLFYNDTRGHLSIWDPQQRASGVMNADNMPTTASISPIDRTNSRRSLLDPALRFGGLASRTNLRPSLSSGSEWDTDAPLGPSRRGSRIRPSSMWNMSGDSDSFDLDRTSLGYQRLRVGGPARSSTYLSSRGEYLLEFTNGLIVQITRIRWGPFVTHPPFVTSHRRSPSFV